MKKSMRMRMKMLPVRTLRTMVTKALLFLKVQVHVIGMWSPAGCLLCMSLEYLELCAEMANIEMANRSMLQGLRPLH